MCNRDADRCLDRTTLRAEPKIERRSAVLKTVQHSASAHAKSPGSALQERLGNRATQLLISRSVTSAKESAQTHATLVTAQPPSIQFSRTTRLPISKPSDPAEIEAEETAKKVMRMREPPAPAPIVREGIGKEAIQRADASSLQRQSTRNVLRHSGRWTDIDSPTVLGLWAKEAAINKLWLGSTLREVQEHPERVPELVEAVLPKLRAALYSPKEFSGSPEARKDADEALQMRWQLPGVGIRDQVLEEFVSRYTKQLELALAHTPKGTELVTRPEEIWRVRHNPYDGIWWFRMQFIHKGQISPPREILDIQACPKGSEDRCPTGEPLRDIWFILKRDPNWIYFSDDQRNDPFDWLVAAVSGEVAESTQFAAELFPYLLNLAGFSLGLSSRLVVILASEILNALGEQGLRAARGEKMLSALEVVEGIGFGVVTTHFLGRLLHKNPGSALEQNLEDATERAAARARVEVARTDASLVERELQAGRARAVEDLDLLADGYLIEVDVISEGQKRTWRLNTKGSWCRFSKDPLCVRQLSDAVDDAARKKIAQVETAPEPGLRRDDPKWSKQASQVEENAVFGRMNEEYLKIELRGRLGKNFTEVGDQVWIRPNTRSGQPAGFYFIADNVAREGNSWVAIDAKLTASAGLTTNQTIGYPMLSQYGGTVVGHNTPAHYPFGMELPPISSYRAIPTVDLKTTPIPTGKDVVFRYEVINLRGPERPR